MKNTRANPVFALVRPRIEAAGLPVLDTEDMSCWENIEYSLLALEHDQFDILWKDYKSNTAENIKKKEAIKLHNAPTKTEHEENIDLETIKDEIVENKYIYEMEKAFAEGDKNSVLDMLKKFEK